MSTIDLHGKDEKKQRNKRIEQSARVEPVLDRRSLAFEMGLGVATAAAISLSSFSQTPGAVCGKSGRQRRFARYPRGFARSLRFPKHQCVANQNPGKPRE